jgi:NADH-quinone oxidoreductase subunit F
MASFLKTPAAWPTILLERAFADDPTDLDEAVRAGAFTGLRKAIRDLGETGTIATIAGSGLRGRGGGGFPAAD